MLDNEIFYSHLTLEGKIQMKIEKQIWGETFLSSFTVPPHHPDPLPPWSQPGSPCQQFILYIIKYLVHIHLDHDWSQQRLKTASQKKN